MGELEIHSQHSNADFCYHDDVPPQCLKKLYWHDFVVWLGLMAFLAILMFGAPLRQYIYFWKVFLSALISWIVINYFRKRLLEEEVLRSVPSDWHLIYRFYLNEHRYAPELVPGHEFKDILQRTVSWHRFNTVRIAGAEKRRLKIAGN